jgi:sugar O-acyltransferase (sialic acid O-acetyltransferase NeuD family)
VGLRIIIVGAFSEIIELAEELKLSIIGLVDNKKNERYYGYKIIHNDCDGSVLSTEFNSVPIVITPDLPAVRVRLSENYRNAGFGFFNLISGTAKISRNTIIGNGIIIQHGVNVSAEVTLGDFVKLNTNCNVMHNACIGDFTTVAPNAVVLGNVKIGNCCYIGSNATILPGINICNNSIIGAGAVVTKDIIKPGKYVGNPARFLKD